MTNDRVTPLNGLAPRKGKYVLYWMQQSQRTVHNHALEYAATIANDLDLPVVAGFGLTDSYPEANVRHYTFMLEGLAETAQQLKKRKIAFVVRLGDPANVALDLGRDAACIICDCGYLRHQKLWRKTVASRAPCPVVQVETDVTVPVEEVSDKQEYAARTIRPKLHRLLKSGFVLPKQVHVRKSSTRMRITGIDVSKPGTVLQRLRLNGKVDQVSRFFQGGMSNALKLLNDFVRNSLTSYVENGKKPHTGCVSRMGPFLHFGQVSPVYIARTIHDAEHIPEEARDAYIEQLVVRRELSMNFVHHCPNYDSFACLPDWATRTLKEHAGDKRQHTYSMDQLDSADTHDVYWNAAMREMKITGYMHNYMRMYWGKKILEWSVDPREAYDIMLQLNNRYFLDGRDPNSYAGVAWVFGMHDRPWTRRPIFGTVRYMAASGLERKCEIEKYVEKIQSL